MGITIADDNSHDFKVISLNLFRKLSGNKCSLLDVLSLKLWMETRNSRFLSAVNSNSRTSSNDEISAIIILREFAEAKRGAPSILGIHLLPGEKFPVHPFLDSNFRS